MIKATPILNHIDGPVEHSVAFAILAQRSFFISRYQVLISPLLSITWLFEQLIDAYSEHYKEGSSPTLSSTFPTSIQKTSFPFAWLGSGSPTSWHSLSEPSLRLVYWSYAACTELQVGGICFLSKEFLPPLLVYCHSSLCHLDLRKQRLGGVPRAGSMSGAFVVAICYVNC